MHTSRCARKMQAARHLSPSTLLEASWPFVPCSAVSVRNLSRSNPHQRGTKTPRRVIAAGGLAKEPGADLTPPRHRPATGGSPRSDAALRSASSAWNLVHAHAAAAPGRQMRHPPCTTVQPSRLHTRGRRRISTGGSISRPRACSMRPPHASRRHIRGLHPHVSGQPQLLLHPSNRSWPIPRLAIACQPEMQQLSGFFLRKLSQR